MFTTDEYNKKAVDGIFYLGLITTIPELDMLNRVATHFLSGTKLTLEPEEKKLMADIQIIHHNVKAALDKQTEDLK